MRLREHHLHQRMLCLLVAALVLAPLATAARLPVPRDDASSPPPVLRAEDLAAGLTASAARASGDLAWHHEEDAFLAHATRTARGALSIVVEGVDVVSFRYDAPRDRSLGVLLDGVAVAWLPAGEDAAFDLALDGARRTVSWSVVAAAGDAFAIRGVGPEPLLDPTLRGLPSSLLVCVSDLLPIRLGWARGLAVDALDVRIDGEPVEAAGVEHRRGWGLVETALLVPVPPQEAPRRTLRVEVDARVGDRVVEVVDRLVETVIDLTVLWTLPEDWVYDLRPAIGVRSACVANPVVDVRLTVDGEDVTPWMTRDLLGVRYAFDRDLAFRERHEYVLEAQLRHGPPLRFERAFAEGLDVLELDVQAGWLHVAKVPGSHVMLAPENAASLPPVRADNAASFLVGQTVWLPEGGRLRAVHAPLAIRCDASGVCDPYGGDAPGFFPGAAHAATLTVTGAGAPRTLPALGQLVAASHQSRVDPSPLADALDAPA